MSLAMLFGQVLREERIKNSITQEELSHLCDLDRTYISLLERGHRQPTINTLFTISKALDINASYIIKKIEERI